LTSRSHAERDDLSEAASIVEAVRRLQGDAELRARAASDLSGVLDRLGLSGVARQAVASSLAPALASGIHWPPRGFIFWA
jgi:hypothetical protein